MIGTVMRIGWSTLKRDRAALLLTFVLQLLITYVPFAQNLFGIQALPLPYLFVSLLLSTVIFWAVEVEKWFKRRKYE